MARTAPFASDAWWLGFQDDTLNALVLAARRYAGSVPITSTTLSVTGELLSLPIEMQVAAAADGRVAAHTGGNCMAHAGDSVGDGFSCQANIMASERVWGAMAEAFPRSTFSGSMAVVEAAKQIKAELCARAAKLWDVKADEPDSVKGRDAKR